MSAIATARRKTSATSKGLVRTLKKVVFRTLAVFGVIYVANVTYLAILMRHHG
jgi:hypothetical protein